MYIGALPLEELDGKVRTMLGEDVSTSATATEAPNDQWDFELEPHRGFLCGRMDPLRWDDSWRNFDAWIQPGYGETIDRLNPETPRNLPVGPLRNDAARTALQPEASTTLRALELPRVVRRGRSLRAFFAPSSILHARPESLTYPQPDDGVHC